MKLSLKQAQGFGRVSDRNSKMPASSFALHTARCSVGSKLRNVEGSTCAKCYAVKFEAMYPSVDAGHKYNSDNAAKYIAEDSEGWSQAIALQITKICAKFVPFHRWFDAGDLQDVAMLRAIVRVCELTPHIRHWLPTREAGIVKAYRRTYGELPSNLVVRISATMIGDKPVSGHAHTSTVHRKGGQVHGAACDAASRGHACGDCRACWDANVPNVSYPLH